MSFQKNLGFLPIAITILALSDGVLHLYLRFALFGGPRPGGPAPGTRPVGAPPPGSRPPGLQLPLPLTELFILNFVGYLVMILVFWLAPRWLGAKSWLIDIGFIIYTSLATIAWWEIGKPNPMGLGYLSKAVEIVLIVALLVHAGRLVGRREEVGYAS